MLDGSVPCNIDFALNAGVPVGCILQGLNDVAKIGGAQRCVRQHMLVMHTTNFTWTRNSKVWNALSKSPTALDSHEYVYFIFLYNFVFTKAILYFRN